MTEFEFNTEEIESGKGNWLWRFLKDGETNDNEFNIWDIMGSKTMREYYKKNIKLSIEGVVYIIIRAHISIDEKINLLEKLNDFYFSKMENAEVIFIDSCIFYLTNLKNIFTCNSNNTYIYLVKELDYVCNIFKYVKDDNKGNYLDEYLDESYIQLTNDINCLNDTIVNTEFPIVRIDAYNASNMELVAECVAYDKEITHLFYRRSDNSLFSKLDSTIYSSVRFYTPYKNGDSVNISIPGVDSKITGIIKKELCDDWYAFLDGYNENNFRFDFDLGYIGLNHYREFSIFDTID